MTRAGGQATHPGLGVADDAGAGGGLATWPVVSSAPATTPVSEMAAEAARRSGVQVRTSDSVEDLERVDRLLAEIWGGPRQDAVSVNMMKALAHSGHYIGTAWRGPDLVGAAVGFAHGPDGDPSLHSHIAGVRPGQQGSGVGYALKLHQAEWSLRRGLGSITWTFDPLVRRNAWFNLVKLGARGEKYFSDFYGAMHDEINDGDATDRCLAVWDLSSDLSRDRPVAEPAAAVLLLEIDEEGGPSCRPDPAPGRDVLLCPIPADVVELRRREPALAGRWRQALRATMGRALASGFVATSVTSDGCYVLERRDR